MGLFDFLKRKKSPFEMVSEKLTSDLAEAQFSGDWEKRQEINLKLTWLTFVKNQGEIWTNYLPKQFQGLSKEEDYKKLNIESIKFPNDLDENVILHYKFSEQIIKEYGKCLANSGKYQNCLFKPAALLPYPKSYIRKSIQFTEYCLNMESPLFVPPSNKKEILDNLGGIVAYLENFVFANENELPTDTKENMKVGLSISK